MLTMKDLKTSVEKFNEVTDNIKSLINSNKNKKNINQSKLDDILIKAIEKSINKYLKCFNLIN